MDNLTRAERQRCMSRIRSRDSNPEMRVRRWLHKAGYRYRLHVEDLPGTPDIVFPRDRKVIFVHGCFWHRHFCKRGRLTPATRAEYWQSKFQSTVARDRDAERMLKRLGWKVLVVWECEVRSHDRLGACLRGFLAGQGRFGDQTRVFLNGQGEEQ